MDEPTRPAFGQRLDRALSMAKKTRKELAAHLSVSVQSIGQVINGPTVAMTADNCARAARFLGVSAYWLATGEGDAVERAASPTASEPALFIGQLVVLFQKLTPDEQHEHLIELNHKVDLHEHPTEVNPFPGNRRQVVLGRVPERRTPQRQSSERGLVQSPLSLRRDDDDAQEQSA